MPNNKIHTFFSKRILGFADSEIHQWIDEPVKSLGFQHREERHDLAALIYCGKRWGVTGLRSALLHQLIDTDLNCGLVPRHFDNMVEKILVDENIRNICDHYAECIFVYYSGNLRSYKAKLIYSQTVETAKRVIPKGLRIKIKSLTQTSKSFIFYSKERPTDDIRNELTEINKSMTHDIESEIMNIRSENLIWDYTREIHENLPTLRMLVRMCPYDSYEEIKQFKYNTSSFTNLTVEGKFAACHSISSLPKGHKCKNLHGHEWRYRCTFLFPVSEVTKISEDFGIVKDILRSNIEDVLDHSNLNDVFEVSSAEEIAKWIFNVISKEYEELMEVRVKETETSWITYTQELNSRGSDDNMMYRYREVFNLYDSRLQKTLSKFME